MANDNSFGGVRTWCRSAHLPHTIVFLSILFMVLPARAVQHDNSTHEQGRRIYNYRCYFCHGYSGDARTLASRFLIPPPRDFTALPAEALTRAEMLETVGNGKPGTAMKPFRDILAPREIAAVVDFVRIEFMVERSPNTRYHTVENGWPDHERYRAAFPFATGEIALDTPWEALDEERRAGKRLFLDSCISCHDRARVNESGPVWERQALSYPRFGFESGDHRRPPDAYSGASPYARHDVPLKIKDLSELERRGERLFIANCAFCHAADGTGANWIGRFLEPHPRNLTDAQAMAAMTRSRLQRVISEGIPGTSMPAWKAVLDDEQIGALIAYVNRAFHPLAEQ